MSGLPSLLTQTIPVFSKNFTIGIGITSIMAVTSTIFIEFPFIVSRLPTTIIKLNDVTITLSSKIFNREIALAQLSGITKIEQKFGRLFIEMPLFQFRLQNCTMMQ